MNFSRFFELDKKLLVKVIAGVMLLAVAFAFYLVKNKASDDNLTVSVTPDNTAAVSVQATEPAIKEEIMIMVDVAGAVVHPSVVELPEGSRVFEAVEKAGGLTAEADTGTINQAEILTDGQKIYIPTKQEIKAGNSGGGFSGSSVSGQSSLININTADSSALQEIPGIGPATAEKIISYRNENGKFNKIEDIKNVSGIGDKTFEKMKKKITV